VNLATDTPEEIELVEQKFSDTLRRGKRTTHILSIFNLYTFFTGGNFVPLVKRVYTSSPCNGALRGLEVRAYAMRGKIKVRI
jgi:hypothetical protein